MFLLKALRGATHFSASSRGINDDVFVHILMFAFKSVFDTKIVLFEIVIPDQKCAEYYQNALPEIPLHYPQFKFNKFFKIRENGYCFWKNIKKYRFSEWPMAT